VSRGGSVRRKTVTMERRAAKVRSLTSLNGLTALLRMCAVYWVRARVSRGLLLMGFANRQTGFTQKCNGLIKYRPLYKMHQFVSVSNV
jgi:hypothetical protein